MATEPSIGSYPVRMRKGKVIGLSVCRSVGTKNTRSPDPICAKYLQAVQNIEKPLCLCIFLLD